MTNQSAFTASINWYVSTLTSSSRYRRTHVSDEILTKPGRPGHDRTTDAGGPAGAGGPGEVTDPATHN